MNNWQIFVICIIFIVFWVIGKYLLEKRKKQLRKHRGALDDVEE